MNHNPLTNYFRTPGIHISLPTRGKYNKGIDTSMTGEIPILPLTTSDELYVNNPDSLLNGSAVEQIVHSCAPSIKIAPRKLAMADIDVIMLASKLVTYGDELKLDASCPKCSTPISFSLSIRDILASAKEFPDESIVKMGNGLIFYLKPYDLEASTKIQMAEFNESALLRSLTDPDMELSEKTKLLQPSLNRMVHSLIDVLCDGIEKIVIEETKEEVTEARFINELIKEAPASLSSVIQKKQDEFKEYGIPKTTEVTCKNEKCNHKWDARIIYDPSTFFVSDS